MRYSRLLRALLAALVLLLGNPDRAAAIPNEESRAAAVLFDRFETVLYAEGKFLSSWGRYRGVPKDDADRIRVQFANLLGGLDALMERAPKDLLQSGDAFLMGAKDFRSPEGLGRVRSQFCYIVVLGSRRTFDLRKYVSQPSVDSLGGLPLWSWSAKLGEFGEDDPRPSLLYGTQIGNSYLLISNHREEIRLVAERLLSPDGSARTLSGIHEWELLSQRGVWAYRRYRHNEVVDRMAAGMDVVAPGAEALLFYFDTAKKRGVLRLFLDPPHAERTPAQINAEAMLPPLEPVGWGGIWETRFRLKGDEKSFERMFVVMGLFGFAVYL